MTTETPASETPEASAAAQAAEPAKRRLWLPVAVAALTAGGLVYLHYFTDLTRDFRWIGSVIIGGSGIILLGLWMLFLSRLPKSVRYTTVFLPLAALAIFFAFYRVLFDGDLVPYAVEPRWWGKQRQQLAAQAQTVSRAVVAEAPADMPRPDYHQFLGPQRDGIVPGPELARSWDQPPKQLWKVPIGAGWSGFSIVGDYVYTQEMRERREMVTCLELKSGDLVWRQFQNENDEAEGFVSAISGDGPRATPTVDQGHVYTAGSTGTVNCFDAADGKRLWSVKVLEQFGANLTEWGYSISPLVVDDKLIVTGGGKTGPTLIALNRTNGEVIWTAGEGGECSDAYSSPTLATVAGVRQILIVSDKSVEGYDPETGTRLWRQDWPWKGAKHAKISQPLVASGDRLLITAAYSSGSALVQLHREADGTLRPELLWKNRNLKAKFSNPIVLGEYAYGLDMIVLTCLDLNTGERTWKGGRFGHGQMLQVGDLTLVISENGELVLMELTPEKYTELGRIQALEGKTWNTMAIAGNLLLVRNSEEAACFELPTR